MNRKKRKRRLMILLEDVDRIYIYLENELTRFRSQTNHFHNHSISLGNEGLPSARQWRFVMTMYFDEIGCQRVQIKYFFPSYHKNTCRTKTMHDKTNRFGVRAYVRKMALSRMEESEEYYRNKQLDEIEMI